MLIINNQYLQYQSLESLGITILSSVDSIADGTFRIDMNQTCSIGSFSNLNHNMLNYEKMPNFICVH